MQKPTCVFIMAGGSGERFWPMSRKALPKHLLHLISDVALVEATRERVAFATDENGLFVLTNRAQWKATCDALPGISPRQVIAEPAKRDTAPACALATALARLRHPEATVAVLPADAVIRDVPTFQRQFRDLLHATSTGESFGVFGITPTWPCTGFGYVEMGNPLPDGNEGTHLFEVARFVEKPDSERAADYVASGKFGWNGGIYMWHADFFLEEARRLQPELARFIEDFPADLASREKFMEERFPLLPKISVDYAIMEKAKHGVMARSEFDWDDVGTWTALPSHLPTDAKGNSVRGAVTMHNSSQNIVVSNGRHIALCGVDHLVVVETADAILVCHRDAVQDVKKVVEQLPDTLQ
jgi:mannose-1-phosphate guanylyltransferase